MRPQTSNEIFKDLFFIFFFEIEVDLYARRIVVSMQVSIRILHLKFVADGRV